MTATTDRPTSDRPTASERIAAEVTSWPGVQAGPGRRGELAFTVARRPLGHLHGDADVEDVIALLRLNYDRATG